MASCACNAVAIHENPEMLSSPFGLLLAIALVLMMFLNGVDADDTRLKVFHGDGHIDQ